MHLDIHNAPIGFIAVNRNEFNFEKIGNVCRVCDARNLCQENKNNWCFNNRCTGVPVIDTSTGLEYYRPDGYNVVFIKNSNVK